MVTRPQSVNPLSTLRGWPRRRWVVAAVLVAPMALLYASAGGTGGWLLPVAAVTAVPASVLLASYLPVPGSGRWVDAGCTPCAAVSGAAVVGSLAMRSLEPGDPGLAVVAAGMVAFGLARRLAGPVTCAARR